MKRTILAICSDPHGGHRYGLLNPATILDEINENGEVVDQYHPPLNKIQEYLWKVYTSQIKAIQEYAKGDDIIVAINGDLTTGDKYKNLMVSDRDADQVIIAHANMLPWYEINPRAVKIIHGTGAHNFGFGTSEILTTRLLKETFPNVPTSICEHSLMQIGENGMLVDMAHHGPVAGSRLWLKGNEARYYLRSCMMEDIVAGKQPPRLYVRGHYHEEIEETLIVKANGNRYKSTLIIVPSFTFIDAHARQTCKSPSRITHGMFVCEIVDGELFRTLPLTITKDIRTKEII